MDGVANEFHGDGDGAVGRQAQARRRGSGVPVVRGGPGWAWLGDYILASFARTIMKMP